MTEYADGELYYSLGHFGTHVFAAYPFPLCTSGNPKAGLAIAMLV